MSRTDPLGAGTLADTYKAVRAAKVSEGPRILPLPAPHAAYLSPKTHKTLYPKTFQCKDLAWRVLPGYTAGREFCIGQLSPPRAAEGPMIAD